jgi:hypothetical protein
MKGVTPCYRHQSRVMKHTEHVSYSRSSKALAHFARGMSDRFQAGRPDLFHSDWHGDDSGAGREYEGVLFPSDGVARAAAQDLGAVLKRRFGRINSPDDEMVETLYPHFRGLLRTSQVLHVEQFSARSPRAVALLQTQPLFSRGDLPEGSLLAALQKMDVEQHGFGWHLHPLDRDGKHMRYKMLFDGSRHQREMSWELHGKGADPWGDPARRVLPNARSRELHSAALAAVLKHSAIARPRERFREWASYFEEPGRTAFIAHPPVQSVTPW